MTTDRFFWRFAYTATALSFAFLLSPQSSGAEHARPIVSLTMDERRNLPGNTQVSLPSGQTATLEVLREEHRAHEESLANAASLGRAFAARISNPTQMAGPLRITQAATPTLQQRGSVTPGASSGAGFNTTAGAVQQPKQNRVLIASDGRNLGGGVNEPPNPNIGKMMVGPSRAAFGFLVPLPVYQNQSHPVPQDYYTFCRAAQASACVYLPANLMFEQFAGALEFDDWLLDASTCTAEGGDFEQQDCQFYYFEAAGTRFTPGSALSSAESCTPGSKYSVNPSAYMIEPKGFITASYPPVMERDNFSLPNPVSCVVQVWVVP